MHPCHMQCQWSVTPPVLWSVARQHLHVPPIAECCLCIVLTITPMWADWQRPHRKLPAVESLPLVIPLVFLYGARI